MKRILCLTLSILLLFLCVQPAFAAEPDDVLYGDAFVQWSEQQIKDGIDAVAPETLTAERDYMFQAADISTTVLFALLVDPETDTIVFSAQIKDQSLPGAQLTMQLLPNGKAQFRQIQAFPEGDITGDLSKTYRRNDVKNEQIMFIAADSSYGLIWQMKETHTLEAWDAILQNAFGLRLCQLGFYKLCPDHKLVSYRREEADCEKSGKDYLHCETCRMETINEIPGGHHLFGSPVTVKPASCFENGLRTETCTRCGFVLETELPMFGEHQWQTTFMPATIESDGYEREECAVCGYVYETRVIPKIASITLSTDEYTYTGKVRRPKVIVKDRTGAVVPAGNYSVKYPKGRKDPGVYNVSIRMTSDDYAGNYHAQFTIVPARANGLMVSGKKLTWNKVDSAQKYVVYYRVGKTGDFVKLKSTLKTAVSLKKLPTGKTIYFKVRTYVRDPFWDVTLWGKYSKAAKCRL